MRGALAILAALAAATGCGGDDGGGGDAAVAQGCEFEDRAPDFELGIEATGDNGYKATLEDSQPFPAARNDNAWTIAIQTVAGSNAANLAVDVNPRMPDHGHGTPIEATVTEVSAGTYEIDPINLWMPGYWEVNLTLSDGENTLDSLTFKVCIDP